MKKIKFWILTILMISTCLTQAQNHLSEEDAFLYYLKIYDYKLADNSPAYGGINWFNVFLRKFRAEELKFIQNDEFKKKEFGDRTNKEINSRLTSLSLNKVHSLAVKASLGNYDFNKKAFPLILDIDKFPSLVSNAQNLYVKIFDIVNLNDMNLYLPVNQSSAESFLNDRKSSNGNIDRTVVANLHFNFTEIKVNRNGANNFNRDKVVVYAHKIDVYNDNNSQKALGTIKPTISWDNTVIPIRNNNGSQKIYYNSIWELDKVKDSLTSPFYSVIQYKEGKLVNPVKTYYNKSNKILSEINCSSIETGNWRFTKGESTWFWENGNVKEKGYFNESGYKEGFYQEYWRNGQLKSKLNYINGKANGCFEKFKENGECDFNYGSRSFESFNNDIKKFSDPNCICNKNTAKEQKNSNNQELNSTSSTSKTIATTNHIFSSTLKGIPYLDYSVISAAIFPPINSNSFLFEDFEFLKSQMVKQPKLFERLNDNLTSGKENISNLKIEIKTIELLKGNSGGYTCNIDFTLNIQDFYENGSKLRDTYNKSGSVSSGLLSLGVTKEQAIEKVAQKLADKINSFLFETYPMKLEILQLMKDTEENISSISVINFKNISSNNLNFYIYDSSEVKSFQNRLMLGEPIGKLSFDKKSGNEIILEVKNSKLKKELAKISPTNLIVLAK